MKNIKKFALTLLGCAVLAACGSGGSKTVQQSIDQSKAKAKETLQKAQQQSKQKTNQAKQKANDKIQSAKQQINNALSTTSGKAISVSGKDEKAIAKWNDINQASLTSITVDGKTVAIAKSGILNDLTACCGKFNDVRFGVVEGGPNDTAYIFVNGNPTKTMPTSGVANYTGKAVVTGNSKQFSDEDYLFGTSKFTADFGAKTLNGTLNIDTLKPISVQANISGNDFKGSASSSEFSTKADVAGKFYGEKAKELGGVFKDGSAIDDKKSWGGAFGASQ